MTAASLEKENIPGGASPYSSNWEYLADELAWLNTLLRLRLARFQQKMSVGGTDLLEQLRGLVISDEEVHQLLGEEKPAPPAPTEFALHSQRLEQRLRASHQANCALFLPLLGQLFHLTPFEMQCVLVCLAPELDRKYDKIYAYLQDDVTRKKPSVDLLLDLLCQSGEERLAARAVFAPQSPLVKYRLVTLSEPSAEGPVPLLGRWLKLDDRIVNFLVGHQQLDARLDSLAQLLPHNSRQPLALHQALHDQMREFLQAHFRASTEEQPSVIVALHGPAGSGKRDFAAAVSHELNRPLLVADVEQIVERSREHALPFAELAWIVGREALLQPAVLCLENVDGLTAEPNKHRVQLQALLEASRTFCKLTFVTSKAAWQPPGPLPGVLFLSLAMPEVEAHEAPQLWQSQLAAHQQFAAEVEWGVLASKFWFQVGQIRAALVGAEALARWRSPAALSITMTDLHAACRAQATPKLDLLARRLTPKYRWDDIVLPDDQQSQLHELCQQARLRHIVYGEWGFARKLPRGKGLNALFSGPPGTGKTMAAEVIATELQLDLYQIDLSQVVSKYIGETEKNLHRIFQEAGTSNAILFFDEADALFGKRSEVKDAHDRYANIEIGYLLQKMEEYEGVAMLATNLSQNLDEAFVRRMQFIVEFPFPDEEQRRRIWEVTFPLETPLSEDMDFALLAREIKLAGGNIKNIGVAAAFYAASDGGVVGMSHLAQAARREFQKLGRSWSGGAGLE